ncbi:MAG: hypothetical protein JJ900_15795 [Rhodospirillales bacterium]|nr:hypothetical protein [Rhodospirillales bacterium]MBO6788311.1 hypothetical protein [Rhodospirillales bacterium]
MLPNITKYEGIIGKAHLKSVKLGNDYIKACHIASTLQQKACISAGNKDIDTVYNVFNKPVGLLNTTVIDASKGVADVNQILETALSPSFNIALKLHGPVVDVSKYVKELEHEIDKLEKEMRRHIHIRIHPFDWKFEIEHLLKEWKAEMKKLEHLVNLDKLKKEMRKAVEKVLHPIVHAIEKFIHKLEHDMTPPGLDMSKLEADLKAIEKFFESLEPHYDFSEIDKAIKEIEDAIRALESCK